MRRSSSGLLGASAQSKNNCLTMLWRYSHRADERSRLIADRHYSRQKVGTPQFVAPGRCAVFYAAMETGQAFWVTSWPFAEWVKHDWAGAWVCAAFRNEGVHSASILIKQALSASRAVLGEPPELGMITFIDRRCRKCKKQFQKCGCAEPNWIVRPTMVHGKPVWGWTYRKAGFVDAGETKGGLLALQIWPNSMPPAIRPLTELEAAAQNTATTIVRGGRRI